MYELTFQCSTQPAFILCHNNQGVGGLVFRGVDCLFCFVLVLVFSFTVVNVLINGSSTKGAIKTITTTTKQRKKEI